MIAVRPASPPSKTRVLNKTADELRAQFAALKCSRDVAKVLDLPYWQLNYAIRRSNPQGRYKSISIPKKNGDTRLLMVPGPGLAAIQHKLAEILSAMYRPRGCVHGFVKARSVVTNARPHVRQEWVLNVDLKDFFASINFGRVRGVFMKKPYNLPADVATTLAQICCHENQLPQGASTSPVISNIICARLDGEMLLLARAHRLTYTRFADDLTFSTRQKVFPDAVATFSDSPPQAKLGSELQNVICINGFEPNFAKCRLLGRGVRQEVTGVNVNRFPNVQRTFVRKTRAMLHAWEKFGLEAARDEHTNKMAKTPLSSFQSVVRGHLAYLSMVRGSDDELVLTLWDRYAKLDPRYAQKRRRALHEVVRDSLWVLECEVECYQGTAFSVDGYGLLSCEHVLGTATHAFKVGDVGRKYPVKVIKRAKGLDLALLHIDAPSGASLSLANKYRPNIGDHVSVAGFPNYQIGDSGHYLSQRVASTRYASGSQRVLIDGPIAAGMSGGPVVDATGQVLGVIVSGAEVLSQANMTERHGFIPIEVVWEFLKESAPVAQTVEVALPQS